ncbi:MAG: hypothetical protein ACI4BD_01820 [Paludibacteraceae bacterium]
MKKRFLLAAMAIVATTMVAAQPRSIGGRLSYGIEITYQHNLSSDRMITLDAGFPGFFVNGFNIEGVVTHDWLNPFNTKIPWNNKGEWNWYMGVGGGLDLWWHGDKSSYGDGYGYNSGDAEKKPAMQTEAMLNSVRYFYSHYNIGVAGRIGVEYNFWFPMQIAVDWRPMFGLGISSTSTTLAYSDGSNEKTRDTGAYFSYGGFYGGNTFAISIRYLFH